MLYPYSQRLTESALRAVYPQQQILSVSLSKDEQEKTTIDGLHVIAVAGIPNTEDVYLFAEDKKGVPYAFSADTAASYDGGVVTKSQEAQATLYKFGIHATLQKEGKEERGRLALTIPRRDRHHPALAGIHQIGIHTSISPAFAGTFSERQ